MIDAMHYRGGRVSSSTVVTAVAVAVLYLWGTQIGLLLTPHNQPVSLLWPPNALLLAALLLMPRTDWAWCVLAVLPVHLTTQLLHGISLSTSVGWYFTNVGESLLGAFWLTRARPPRDFFQDLAGLALFLLISVVGATGLTSFFDAAVVIATEPGQRYWDVWEQRFVSNALATLTLVPPIVMVGSSNLARLLERNRRWFAEAALLVILTMVIVDLLLEIQLETQVMIPALMYSVLPLLFWAAIRFGPTAVGLLQLVVVAALLRAVPDRVSFSLHDVWSLQMLLAMLSVLSLSLAVVVRERSRLQSLHSAVLRSIPDALAILDPAGVVIETNEAWTDAGDHKMRPPFVGVKRHANYLDRLRGDIENWRDGATIVAGLEEILSGARTYFDVEYEWRTEEQSLWFSVAAVPLTGDRRGAVITHSEITTRKRTEAETVHLRNEIAVAGRMMTMAMLSASLTHELSQPLTAVLGNAQAARRLVARELKGHRELDAILTDVVSASHRASSILSHLRSWFKTGRLDAHRLSLNDVVTDVVTVLQSDLLRRGVSVVSRFAPDLPDVRGDRMQLQQVVLNLILNACEAMSEIEPGERQITITTALAEGRIELSIEDVGTGFPPERLTSLFEPFVSTKPTGLGLGLALCKAILQAHDGEVSARNNDDRGATVCCVLPCAPDPASEEQPDGSQVAVIPR